MAEEKETKEKKADIAEKSAMPSPGGKDDSGKSQISSAENKNKKPKVEKKTFIKKKRRFRRGGRRERSEYEQKIIDIRRVTRVVAGGRRFSFSVAMVIGDRKGSVGVGLGKAGDTALAIEKSFRDAKKNMIKPSLTDNMSVPFEVEIKYKSTRLFLMPTPGKGLKAGSSVRTVLELCGVTDVSAKLLSRSKNKLNNARAAIEALRRIKRIKNRNEASGGKEAGKEESGKKKISAAK